MHASGFVGALCAIAAVCAAPGVSRAQDSTATRRPWYDRLSISGYAQFRYNRLLETNDRLKCPTCDRSIGDNGGFFLRRSRISISAQVSDRVSVSTQPDFTTEVGGRENTLVLRHYFGSPEYDAPSNAITEQHLTGGYGLVSYEREGPGQRRVVAYVRAQYFQGAFNTDPDARSSVVHEYEPGIEWNVQSGFG